MNAPVVALKKKSERSSTQNSPSEVRTAYPYFHEKRTKNAAGQPFLKKDGTPNPRHSATFMFPKLSADPHQCANYLFLWGLAVEAARKMWPQNVDGAGQWVWPQGAQYAVKDGDVPFVPKAKPGQPQPSAEEIAKKNAWRRGYWIVEAEHFMDPGPRICKVVNGQVHELPAKMINGQAMYKSGDFGFVNIHAYAYENETFGINFGFDGFCFTREGEAIGSSGPRSAAQMFGSVAGMAAPGAAMPSAGPAPTAPPVPNVAAGGMINAVAAMTPLAAPVAPAVAPAAPTMAPQFPGQLNPPVAHTAPVAPPPPPAPGMAPAVAGLPPIPGRP
jgi:hypothetical protein